jgi:autotransporter-associated beta strand protein
LILAGTNNTYAGPTVISEGTLALNSAVIPGSPSILVKSGATLAGYTTSTDPLLYYPLPLTTVESGGTIAPGTAGNTLYMNGLLLKSATTMNFALDSNSVANKIVSVADVLPAAGTATANVAVSVTGTPAGTMRLLEVTDGFNLSDNVKFSLGSVPKYDSPDGVNAPATLFTQHGANGYVELNAGGLLANIVPAWNVAGNGT